MWWTALKFLGGFGTAFFLVFIFGLMAAGKKADDWENRITEQLGLDQPEA